MKTYVIKTNIFGIETLSFDKISEAVLCFDEKVKTAMLPCNIHILFPDGSAKCSVVTVQ